MYVGVGVKYPPELKEKAIELLKQGLSQRRVARELGVSHYMVKRWAKEAGISRGPKKYPPEVREKALELLKQGLTYREVSQMLGVKEDTLAEWARKAGIKKREWRKYPPEVKEKVLELVKQGVPASQAARQLGVNPQTVLGWVREAGISLGRASYPDEVKEKAVELVKRGLSYKEVAGLLGVTETAVRKWCLKRGVESPYAMKKKPLPRAATPEERKRSILKVVQDFELEKGVKGLAECAERALERSMHVASGRTVLANAGALIHICSKLLGAEIPIAEVVEHLSKYSGAGRSRQGLRSAVLDWLKRDPEFRSLLQQEGRAE
jgi:transposase-like protein